MIIQNANPAMNATPAIQEARHIPYVTQDEAYSLLATALERLLALLETLDAGDWVKPTACTLWNVRDMVAHQAGGYASGTGYIEMLRQYSARPSKGELPEDAINALQLRERAGKTPGELIDELRKAGPIACCKWSYQFRLIKPVAVPHPVGGRLSVRHLMWVTHSRDTWMHRLDICRATNREFVQTREHDGRIVALVMRDVDSRLREMLHGRAIAFELTGVAGGQWKVGTGDIASAIQMDALDFNLLASGRSPYAPGSTQTTLSGDVALAEMALKKLLVLY